jgi:Carbamoyltransferase C-terminus
MKTILNAKIKRRESFRPFAPSVLENAVVAYPLVRVQALLTKTPIFWRSVSEGPILTRARFSAPWFHSVYTAHAASSPDWLRAQPP